MMSSDSFKSRLRAAIDADESLTVAGLAVKAGLDNSTIRNFLDGKASSPRLDTAMKICSALGTTIDQFMGVSLDPDLAEFVSLLEKATPQERNFLLRAAKGALDLDPQKD